jgi:anti-anti-sigma factor
MSTLRSGVIAGQSGPVITLAGEADVTTITELDELVTSQLRGRPRHLTIDVADLRFADTGSIRVFVLAARALRQRGGELILRNPQHQLCRTLQLLGAGQAITIVTEPQTAAEERSLARASHRALAVARGTPVVLAGRPPGYGGNRGVGLMQGLCGPGRRIAALGGSRQPVDERPRQWQGDGQQQPHPQTPGEKCPHGRGPFRRPAQRAPATRSAGG